MERSRGVAIGVAALFWSKKNKSIGFFPAGREYKLKKNAALVAGGVHISQSSEEAEKWL